MLKAFVGVVGTAHILNLAGGNLSVLRGKGQYLVATGFYGSRFVNGNVAPRCRNNSLMASQHGINDGEIGLGAPYQKMYRCLWCSTGFFDKFCCLATEFVLSVAHGLL